MLCCCSSVVDLTVSLQPLQRPKSANGTPACGLAFRAHLEISSLSAPCRSYQNPSHRRISQFLFLFLRSRRLLSSSSSSFLLVGYALQTLRFVARSATFSLVAHEIILPLIFQIQSQAIWEGVMEVDAPSVGC